MTAPATMVRNVVSGAGEFFTLCADTVRASFRRPVQVTEFGAQCLAIIRVSLLPTVMMAIPFTVLVVFTLNSLLGEIGARDLSGAGAGFGAITQIGPLVTVLVVAGTGATAIAADLGSRTIREEIDAMDVLGIDPINRLVVPRVWASTLVAFLLNGGVCAIGIIGGFFFSVYAQDVSPGSYASSLTLLVGPGEVILSQIKAALFGCVAGLIACYRGLAVSGGPKAVGNAVNETVVYAFSALFVLNLVLTAVGVAIGGGQ